MPALIASEEVLAREALKMKPLMGGLDFYRDANWNPIKRTKAGAKRLGDQRMDLDLKRVGFETIICDCGDYFRVNYGKKC